MNKLNRLAGATLLAALAIVGANEGVKYTAYQDPVGKWTICNGITKGVKPGDVATPEWCQDQLVKEILAHAAPLERVPFQLPDHMALAWADFCYNVGVGNCSGSTGYKRLMQGRLAESCPLILNWRYITAGGVRYDCFADENAKRCGGIKNRRQLEYKLCAGQITIAEAIEGLRPRI